MLGTTNIGFWMVVKAVVVVRLLEFAFIMIFGIIKVMLTTVEHFEDIVREDEE